MHGEFARVLALGHLGRAREALAACDDLDRAADRAGEVGARFRGPAANSRAFVLRWTGREAEADECNRAGVEATYASEPMYEARYAGLLDLADGRILAGDLAGAAEVERALVVMDTWEGTMAWYQRHRLHLVRARLALADGDATCAAELATRVAADAASRGARRHELLARAVLGLTGEADPVPLDGVVDGLGTCAGLDGWRAVAELAARFDNRRWRDEAERRAASLIASCGEASGPATRLVNRLLG